MPSSRVINRNFPDMESLITQVHINRSVHCKNLKNKVRPMLKYPHSKLRLKKLKHKVIFDDFYTESEYD